jgi:hypothetical protein
VGARRRQAFRRHPEPPRSRASRYEPVRRLDRIMALLIRSVDEGTNGETDRNSTNNAAWRRDVHLQYPPRWPP